MTVYVHMLAFLDGSLRDVDIPDGLAGEALLDQVFHYGQNEVQPKKFPSVSAGDVIEVNSHEYYLVCVVGFRKMMKGELAEYKELPRVDRLFHRWVRGEK